MSNLNGSSSLTFPSQVSAAETMNAPMHSPKADLSKGMLEKSSRTAYSQAIAQPQHDDPTARVFL